MARNIIKEEEEEKETFLLKTKFYPGKVINYNPCPDGVLKIKTKTAQPTKNHH